MSYTPHTWVDNEAITAAKLNNLEEGVTASSEYGAYDFVIHHNASNGDVFTVLKGSFSDLSTRIEDGEILTGLYIRQYISGTWVFSTVSSTMGIDWNPSYSTIFINVVIYWDSNFSTYPIGWNSTGVYFND